MSVDPSHDGAASGQDDATTGELIAEFTREVSELIRQELRLAQAEVAEKGKGLGIGVGLFGGSGVLALYGVGVVIATVILALATFMAAWLSALIVAIALFAAAGIVALVGKHKVQHASPPVPELAVEGLKQDVATIKGQR